MTMEDIVFSVAVVPRSHGASDVACCPLLCLFGGACAARVAIELRVELLLHKTGVASGMSSLALHAGMCQTAALLRAHQKRSPKTSD